MVTRPRESKFGEVWTYKHHARIDWFIQFMAVSCNRAGLTHGTVLQSLVAGHEPGQDIAVYLNEDWKRE